MFIVGLTGGMGSGKSTVSDLFAELGVPVVDTDLIAHQLTKPGSEALDTIRAVFPDTVIHANGTLDRAALRSIVFDDASAREQLEAILHPRIRREVERAITPLRTPYAMIVIPLLAETGGYRDLIKRVLVVDCPESLQIERVIARSKLSREEIMAILATQASRAQRLAIADDVILNAITLDALRTDVTALHQRYLDLAAVPAP